MKIGIGLPAAIPGVDGERVLEWARKADAGAFSSLAVIDRLVYPNFEPLITLAAAAAVTERVGLMTTILLAPLRNAGVLAKQAATLDAISGGRLTLGLAVGGREDDYRAAPASYQDRGKRFDEQLALMKRIWSGEAAGDGIGPVGPPPSRPGGPELLMGGLSPAALRRVGRWADGYICPGTPESLRPAYDAVEESWEAAGRSGGAPVCRRSLLCPWPRRRPCGCRLPSRLLRLCRARGGAHRPDAPHDPRRRDGCGT